ncbi:MAG: ABC transporter ATP-binding protein [Gammaproteobacteria bacterium]|nr:ABC transporter ATP-binding protein [Gammaproteobacteria bacterium]
MPTAPLITIRDLTKEYQEGEQRHAVLRAVDLDIIPGTFNVLLGRSGTGKSTLLNLISGIDLPTTGSIQIDGTMLTELSEHHRTLFRRRHIGFVFQFFNLIPTLTVAENVMLPLELNGLHDPAGRKERLTELLARVDLEHRASSFPDRLSGGEQQRIALVRALSHRPQILLADEPTGNLDLDSAAAVLTLLRELPCETGTTVVMATHSHDAARASDRVLTITNGTIMECNKSDGGSS